MDEVIGLMALARVKGIDRVRKKWVADHYERVAALFERRRQVGDGAVRDAIRSFDDFKAIDEERVRLSKMGVDVLTIRDEGYPRRLKEIPDAPVVLYKKGALPLSVEALGMVGARKATFEGMLLAERIAETLSSAGITIASGLARGIDASAHKGAMRQRGKTIAVLGCGIDICYPAENASLFDQVAKGGAVVTEYTLGTRPLKHHFPERNRIIAGLSRGVLVVEASAHSGSLITARFALEYGREVMAIPGRVFDDAYKGANKLIKQGARLVEDMEDIVNIFPEVRVEKKSAVDLDGDEDYIYKLMGIGGIHVDELIEKSRLETKKVMAVLTRLEMKDIVSAIPGGFYTRKV